jgi:hypothetical protein
MVRIRGSLVRVVAAEQPPARIQVHGPNDYGR